VILLLLLGFGLRVWGTLFVLCCLLPQLSAGSGDSGGSTRPGGVSISTLGQQMAGLSSSTSGDGKGGLGEFPLCSGGGANSKDLSWFVMDPELRSKLCLGAVNGGVKFCMLACDLCTIGAHAKKVEVVADHVCINAGRNAAYTNPHLPRSTMGSSLSEYLGELHPREDWLIIFHTFAKDEPTKGDAKPLLTPKKHKHRYVTESLVALEGIESLFSSSWDADSSDAIKILTSSVQNIEQRLLDFQMTAGEDVDTLFSCVKEIKAVLGSGPVGTPFETEISGECTTVWEMFTILCNMIIEPDILQSLESKIGSFGSSLLWSNEFPDSLNLQVKWGNSSSY
jgi:hypothetical protein